VAIAITSQRRNKHDHGKYSTWATTMEKNNEPQEDNIKKGRGCVGSSPSKNNTGKEGRKLLMWLLKRSTP